MDGVKFILVRDALPLDDTSLGVGVHNQNPISAFGKPAGDIYSCGGLAHSAFLIDEADDHVLFSHTPPVTG